MGCAPCIGDRRTRFDAGGRETLDNLRQHHGFATMEMVRAGTVDHQTVRCIRHDDGRDPLQGPEREFFQTLRVGADVGIQDDQARGERLRLGNGHADAQAETFGAGVERGDDTTATCSADKNQRCLMQRRCAAQFPSEAIRWPPRKEERYDPCHRKLPLQNPHFRPRDNE